MNRIEIVGLELRGFHGVGEQERKVGNLFKVDVTLRIDLSCAAVSDKVEDTVSYADVIESVKRQMAVSSNLLENVAWRIGQAIRREFPAVTGGTVRVAKVTPPVACQVEQVSVVIDF